jgi:hypothetical protein
MRGALRCEWCLLRFCGPRAGRGGRVVGFGGPARARPSVRGWNLTKARPGGQRPAVPRRSTRVPGAELHAASREGARR